MVARVRLTEDDATTARATHGGNYHTKPKQGTAFVNTGCVMLDLALGGGWVGGRIANIVGDKSTGKTLLCIEACANFAMQHPKGKIYYRESESAFDKDYAQSLGLPLDRVKFRDDLETVEDFHDDLVSVLEKAKGPTLYILDSLDALSDKAEMERAIDAPSYGGTKPKQMSQLFRRLVRRLEKSEVTLLIVSQVRDKIGVTFGDKHSRSGGKALDFYATHVCYLSHLKTVSKTRRGVKRAVAIEIRAKIKKNKIALPYREADFTIRFGYGVDDALACLRFLESAKALDRLDLKKTEIEKYAQETLMLPYERYLKRMRRIKRIVGEVWYEIENSFVLPAKKYG